MAAQAGRELLAKIDTSATATPTYVTVLGLRSKTISLNNSMVDVTDSDSTGQWRELLANAGVKNASFSGSGVFKDQTTDEHVRSAFFSGAIQKWQVIVPAFGTFDGLFQITQLEYAGEYEGEATFSFSLESAGVVGWTAA